jgi:glycosyltransferase involved in cell wall biosynthesis
MTPPAVSIIMTAYDTSLFIGKAIESIMAQSFVDWELIVVDDCSTDDTSRIIKNYQSKDSRIIYLYNSLRNGVTPSRNRGLEIAQGKFIAILDSDDISLPERLSSQYNHLETHPNLFLVGGGAMVVSVDGKFLWKNKIVRGDENLSRSLVSQNGIVHSSVMFRNDGRHFYREKFLMAEDYDFYLRLLTEGKKIDNLKDYIVQYRYNPQSISFQKRIQMILFDELAKQYYRERAQKGRDTYDFFDPRTLSRAQIDDLTEQQLEKLIRFSFSSLDNANAERSITRYHHRFGHSNKFFGYRCFLRMPNFTKKLVYSAYSIINKVFH